MTPQFEIHPGITQRSDKPHVFLESLDKRLSHAEWNAQGQPHCWFVKQKFNDILVYQDTGYGWSVLAFESEDGKIVVADWSVRPEDDLTATFIEDDRPQVYVYRDHDYYGEDVGGLFKRL